MVFLQRRRRPAPPLGRAGRINAKSEFNRRAALHERGHRMAWISAKIGHRRREIGALPGLEWVAEEGRLTSDLDRKGIGHRARHRAVPPPAGDRESMDGDAGGAERT